MLDIVDIILQTYEVFIHQILYVRKVYPLALFEKRLKYGIQLMRCRHVDVNTYVLRVLENLRPMLYNNTLDRIIINTENKKGETVDQISLRFSNIIDIKLIPDHGMILEMEAELKSVMLKILQDDSRSTSSSFCPAFMDDQAWSLLAAVKASLSDDVIQQALTSSEWMLDNGKLPEQRSSENSGNTDIGGTVNKAWSENTNISTTATSTTYSHDKNSTDKRVVIPIKTAQTKCFTFEAFTIKA